MTPETKLVAQVANLLESVGWEVELGRTELGIQIDVYGRRDEFEVAIECKAYQKLAGLRTAREFASVVRFLRESNPTLRGWIVTSAGFTARATEALSLDGLEGFTLTELKERLGPQRRKPSKTNAVRANDFVAARRREKRVFVIMPFSDEMLDVFILGIRWAASELGVVAERADDLEHNGEIIEEVRKAIKEYDVVVGDTTGANPNVCYEVGYAHASRKPTILICREGSALPFDLQGTNHLIYPNILGLREPLRAKLAAALGKSPAL